MPLEVGAALFHFDQHDRLPDVICKRYSAAIFVRLANPKLCNASNIFAASLAHGLKKTVEKMFASPFSSPEIFFSVQTTNSASLSLLNIAEKVVVSPRIVTCGIQLTSSRPSGLLAM
jgi:hypothetical protein